MWITHTAGEWEQTTLYIGLYPDDINQQNLSKEALSVFCQ
jgi:hypothetical protein